MLSTTTQLIRRIGVDELYVIQSLALDIWPKCYRNIIPPDRIDVMLATLYSLENLEHEMSALGYIFWVARARGLDVGYAAAYQDGEILWLKKLYVLDDFRGLSLGRAFMETARAQFPTAKRISLYVNHDNAPAIAYYLKNGFEKLREEPVQMGPFDFVDFVMSKTI